MQGCELKLTCISLDCNWFVAVEELVRLTNVINAFFLADDQNVGKAGALSKPVQTEPVKISLKDCLACRYYLFSLARI